MSAPPVLEIDGVVKAYGALRPLRVQTLTIAPRERVAVVGLDAPAAQLLVNLVTGATLPDQGTVRVLGQSTADITEGEAWLASLDRFGIAGERAVLMEGSTVAQNLAMPFTLDIEPVPAEIRSRVERLAEDCGIVNRMWLDRAAGELPPEIRARVHMARAVALDPSLVLLEHLAAAVPARAHAALAADIVRVMEGRRISALIVTHDDAFASSVAHRALKLQPATGALVPVKKGWFW